MGNNEFRAIAQATDIRPTAYRRLDFLSRCCEEAAPFYRGPDQTDRSREQPTRDAVQPYQRSGGER